LKYLIRKGQREKVIFRIKYKEAKNKKAKCWRAQACFLSSRARTVSKVVLGIIFDVFVCVVVCVIYLLSSSFHTLQQFCVEKASLNKKACKHWSRLMFTG